MTTNKRGPWTQGDKDYIARCYQTQTATEIANYLKRDVQAVVKYIDEHYSSSFQSSAKNAEYHIQSSPVWRDLEKQFSKDELQMFLFHWGRIISQFKEDVYPTEELQVIDTIKLELLMNRALKQQQKCVDEIFLLEHLLNDERDKDKGDKDRDLVFNLEKQIATLRAAQDSINTDYRDMLRRKNEIMKQMKATRDERIKVLESSKQNFGGWMRRLLQDKELRKRLGIRMEKMRLSMEEEAKRLGSYHTYLDGEVDQPLLNSDTVIKEGLECEKQQ